VYAAASLRLTYSYVPSNVQFQRWRNLSAAALPFARAREVGPCKRPRPFVCQFRYPGEKA